MNNRIAMYIAALGALALTACGDDSSSGSTATPTANPTATPNRTAATSGSSDDVVVHGYTFPAISAAAGSTLTLTNQDDEPHTVTADDGSFDTDPFTTTKPATLTVPATPGSYAFHCRIHPTMHGTLVVR